MNSKHLIIAALTAICALWSSVAHAQEETSADAVSQAYAAALEAAGTTAADVTDEQLNTILQDLHQRFVATPGGLDISVVAHRVGKASPHQAALIGSTLAQLEPRRSPAIAAALVSVVPSNQTRRVVNAIVQVAPRYARQISNRVNYHVPGNSITTPDSRQDGPQVSPSAID